MFSRRKICVTILYHNLLKESNSCSVFMAASRIDWYCMIHNKNFKVTSYVVLNLMHKCLEEKYVVIIDKYHPSSHKLKKGREGTPSHLSQEHQYLAIINNQYLGIISKFVKNFYRSIDSKYCQLTMDDQLSTNN